MLTALRGHEHLAVSMATQSSGHGTQWFTFDAGIIDTKTLRQRNIHVESPARPDRVWRANRGRLLGVLRPPIIPECKTGAEKV